MEFGKWRFVVPAIIFTAAAFLFPGILQAAEVISLEQVLEMALKKSPTLAASRNEVKAAAAQVTQAEAAYYPQVSASAGYDHTWNEPHLKTSSTRDNIDSYSTGVSVSQHVYDFGKTTATVEKSRKSLDYARFGLETDENTVVRDVKSAFFEVLKREHLVDVGLEAREAKQRQLAQAKALYKEGMRPGIDVTRSEVDLSKAELSLVSARYDLKRGIVALEKLIGGLPAEGDYTLAESENNAPELPDLATIVATAHEKRSELSGIRAQIAAAEAGNRSDRMASRPNVSAKGSYAYSGDDFPLDQRWQVGMSVNWPIFTGFRQTGQVAESEAGIQRLKALYDQQVLAVTDDVTLAFLGVREAEDSIRTAETVLRQAKENLAQAEGRYRAGVSDAVELSDAQVLYTEARSDLVQAVYNRQKALAVLEFAAGGSL